MISSLLALALVAQPADPVIARVGDETITAADVRARAQGPGASPRVALDDLIAEVVMAKEARSQGVKPPGSAASRVDDARRRAAVQRLLEVEVYPKAQVPEADLKDRFHQRGDQVRLFMFARATEAEARQALDRLAKGGRFADEAAASADPATKAKGGEVGWMARAALKPALAKVVFTAPLNQPQGPVLVEGAYVIYLVEDRRLPDEAAYALVRDRLRQDLEPAARSAAVEALQERLIKEAKGQVDEKFIVASGDALEVQPASASKVVASAGKAKVTYGQLVESLTGGHGGAGATSGRASPEVKATLARNMLGRALLEERAVQRMSKDAAVQRAMAKAERAAMASVYTDQIRKSIQAPTSAEVEGRYQARKAEYVTPGGRTCSQLVAPTEEGVKRLAARVAAGEEFAKVAADSSDRRTAAKGGLVGFVSDVEVEGLKGGGGEAALAAAVVGTPTGQLSAPVKTRAGYRVLRCEAPVPEKGATLEQVRHRLAMEIRAEQGTAAVNRKVQALRAAAKLQIDESAFDALSQPAK